MDRTDITLLSEALRSTMTEYSGPALDTALDDLGWHDMLAEIPEIAIPLVFALVGETGTHASIINDVLDTGRTSTEHPLPMTGDLWLRWHRRRDTGGIALDPELPLSQSAPGPLPKDALIRGRIAMGWWLVGSSRAMLDLARTHALDRTQFGTPIAGFQAVRHRLSETLVAIEGAEATLVAATVDLYADSPSPQEDSLLRALLAKAAAGRAALIACRHAQQVHGGIGFTAAHSLHRHIRRVHILDALLGSSRTLTREAGSLIREQSHAPRLVHL